MKRLWVLLFLCGFSGIALSEGNWKLYSTGSDNVGISSVAVDGDYIWAGVSGTGVVRLNRKDDTYIIYTEKDGLLNNFVNTIAVDNNKVKWFGHLYYQGGKGITSYDNLKWTQFTTSTVPVMAEYDSLHNYHWRVAIDDIVVNPDNTILFSANGQYSRADGGGVQGISNLLIYKNNTWTIKTIPGNSGFPFYLAVDTAYPDTVWYLINGPGMGFFVKPNYDPTTDKRFPNHGGMVVSMDRNNFVWYGCYSDIYKYDRNVFSYFPSDSTGILGETRAISVDKKNIIWFGSQSGITCYNGISWKTYAPNSWEYKNDSSLSDIVNSLAFDDDGILWVGTNKGLYRFEESPVSVQDAAPKPISVSIEGVSPNPFNASSVITFSLPNPDMATLTVYSLTGQKVRTLVSERLSAGKHSATWDGRDERGGVVSSGVFIATLQSGGKTDSRKLLMLK